MFRSYLDKFEDLRELPDLFLKNWYVESETVFFLGLESSASKLPTDLENNKANDKSPKNSKYDTKTKDKYLNHTERRNFIINFFKVHLNLKV